MGIVLGGNCPGGSCPGGNCPGWELSGGNCPGGNCPGANCPVTVLMHTKNLDQLSCAPKVQKFLRNARMRNINKLTD